MLGCVRCTSRHWRVHVNSALASSLLLHVLWSRRINGTTINQQTSRLHSTVSNTPQCHKCLLWFTHTFHLFVCVMSDTSWQLLHYVSAEFAMSPVTSNHQKFEITVNFSSSFISSSAENIRWNIRWSDETSDSPRVWQHPCGIPEEPGPQSSHMALQIFLQNHGYTFHPKDLEKGQGGSRW